MCKKEIKLVYLTDDNQTSFDDVYTYASSVIPSKGDVIHDDLNNNFCEVKLVIYPTIEIKNDYIIYVKVINGKLEKLLQ